MRTKFNALYLYAHIILIQKINLPLNYKVPYTDILEPLLCTLRDTYLRSSPFDALLFQSKISYRYCTVRAGWSGDRIPVERDFPHPSRLAVGSHSLKYSGYRVIPVVKAAEAWHWPPTPSSSEVKERVYVCCPFGPSWVSFTFSSTCSTSTGLCCFLHVALRIKEWGC
jgi:hypothetical protein